MSGWGGVRTSHRDRVLGWESVRTSCNNRWHKWRRQWPKDPVVMSWTTLHAWVIMDYEVNTHGVTCTVQVCLAAMSIRLLWARVPVTRSMAWRILVGQARGIRLLRARVLIYLVWMTALHFGCSRGTILSWTSLLLMRRSISGHFPSSPDSDRNLRMFDYSWDSIRRMLNVVRSPPNARLTSLHRQDSTSLTRKTGHGARHPQQARLSRKTDVTAKRTRERHQHSARVSSSFNKSRTGQVEMSAPDSITEDEMSRRNTEALGGSVKTEGTDSWRPRRATDLARLTRPTAPVKISGHPEVDIAVGRVGDWEPHLNRTHLISRMIVDGNAAHQCRAGILWW